MAKKPEKSKGSFSFSLTLVIVYFGGLPDITPYFLHSCSKNPFIRFLLFTDQEPPGYLPDNVEYYFFIKKEFEALVKDKTGLKIRIRNPYKLCDFKPLYGDLFEDYLNESAFWGYCDLDMILGNTANFLTTDIYENYDVITARKESLAGNFTMYRNTPELRTLYRVSDCWRRILTDTECLYCFDEKCRKQGLPLSRYTKALLKLRLKSAATEEFRIADMNAVLANSHDVSCYYGDFLLSDMILKNRGISDWEVVWNDGELEEVRSNRSIMYFHIYRLKDQSGFIKPAEEFRDDIRKIRITPGKFEIS